MLEAGRYYTTVGGYEVFIYSTDNGGEFPIHARVSKGDRNVAVTYNNKGKTPSSDTDASFDISIPKPEIGEVVLVGNEGDIFPTVALFKGFDRDGFYGIVNSRSEDGGISIEKFDVLISDVEGLTDALDAFVGGTQETVYDTKDELEEEGLVVLDILEMSVDQINSALENSKEIRIVLKGNKEGL